VIGADPNASCHAILPQNAAYNRRYRFRPPTGTGHLSYLVSASLAPQSRELAYVTIDGAQSQTQVWPSVTGSAAPASSGNGTIAELSHSPSRSELLGHGSPAGNGNLGAFCRAGRYQSLSAYCSAISGSQISVTGSVACSATLTVCGANVGCTSLYVTVQAPYLPLRQVRNSGNPAAVSCPIRRLTIGCRSESDGIPFRSGILLHICTLQFRHRLPPSLSGSILTVGGSLAGTDLLSVCGTSGNSTSCNHAQRDCDWFLPRIIRQRSPPSLSARARST